MMCVYDKSYLEDAMANMGEMMDYAANDCHMDMDEFFKLFISSGLASLFEKGAPNIIAGMSGVELFRKTMDISGYVPAEFEESGYPEPIIDYTYSPQYWCGWILAYYQWSVARPFREVMRYLSFDDLERMYSTLHEASEETFIRAAEEMRQFRILKEKPATKLQQQRKILGLSQSQLAKRAGVNLRTLQQYELRAKDINKAAAGTLYSLSCALCCGMEDLLEW